MNWRSLFLAALVVVLGTTVAAPRTAVAGPYTLRSLEGPAGTISPQDEAQLEAKLEFQQGTEAYALGNYEQAVRHFERSFEISHRSELLYNLGMSYSKWYDLTDDAGHLRKAKKLFENYLLFLESSEPRDQAAIDDAHEQIAGIEERLEAHQGRAPPDPQPVERPERDDRPVTRKGWFWAVVVGGVVLVAGGITLGVVLANRDDGGFDPELGTIGGGLDNSRVGGIRF